MGIVGAVLLLTLLPVFFVLLGSLARWVFGVGSIALALYGIWAFGAAFLEDSDFRAGAAIYALMLIILGMAFKLQLDKERNFKLTLGLKRIFVWMTPAIGTSLKLTKIKNLRAIDQQQLSHQEKCRINALTEACILANLVAEKLTSKLSFYIKNHIVEVMIEETKLGESPVILIKKPNASWPLVAKITTTFTPRTPDDSEYSFDINSSFMLFGRDDSFSSIKKLLTKSNKYVERYVANNPNVLDKVCLEESKRVEPNI